MLAIAPLLADKEILSDLIHYSYINLKAKLAKPVTKKNKRQFIVYLGSILMRRCRIRLKSRRELEKKSSGTTRKKDLRVTWAIECHSSSQLSLCNIKSDNTKLKFFLVFELANLVDHGL